MRDDIYWRCSICTGFAIDSQLYLYGRYTRVPGKTTRQHFQAYKIEDSTGTVTLTHKAIHHLYSFNEKYSIFFHANADFSKVSCEIGYRNASNECVDVDECKIMRHYCDLRKRFLLLINRHQNRF